MVVCGEYKLTQAAYDDELGLAIEAARASRSAQKVHITDDTLSSTTDRDKIEWRSANSEYANYIGAADVDSYHLGDSYLQKVIVNRIYSDYDAAELSQAGMVQTIDSNQAQVYFIQYLDDLNSAYYDGELHYFYSVTEPNDGDMVTIVSSQNGDTLKLAEEVTNNLIVGALSGEDVRSGIGVPALGARILSIVFTLAILVPGILLWRKS